MCVRDVFFLLSLCHNSPPWFFTLKNHSQKEAVLPEDFFVSFSFPSIPPEDAFYWIVKVSRKAMFVIMFLPQP